MSTPLSAPNDTPAVNNALFQTAWQDFFNNAAVALNAATAGVAAGVSASSPQFTGPATGTTLQLTGGIGINGKTPAAVQTITGSRGTALGAVVTRLITALDAAGIIIDGTGP